MITGSATAALAVTITPSTAAPSVKTPDWGWSRDGEIWQTGHATREAAIAAAKTEEATLFHTGICDPTSFRMPDWSEDISDWLANASNTELGGYLADQIIGSNVDNQFEDELEQAITSELTVSLGEEARVRSAGALLRIGYQDLAIGILFGKTPSELSHVDLVPAAESLARDAEFNHSISSGLDGWVRRHGIDSELRSLEIRGQEKHAIP